MKYIAYFCINKSDNNINHTLSNLNLMLIQTTIELDDKNGDIQDLIIEGEYCEHEGVLNYCIEFAGIEFEAEVLTAHFPYTAEQIATMACDAIKEEAEKELENELWTRYEFAGDR